MVDKLTLREFTVVCASETQTYTVTAIAFTAEDAASQVEWLPDLPFVQIMKVTAKGEEEEACAIGTVSPHGLKSCTRSAQPAGSK